MSQPARQVIAAFLLLMTFVSHAPDSASAAESLSPEEEAAVRALIEQHLLEKPEIIMRALEALQEQQVTAQAAEQRQALATHRRTLVDDGHSFVGGNPQAETTVVEFFDYHCPYCKQALPIVRRLMEERKDVRVVFKELPILGPESLIASRAAMAAIKQGRYLPFHEALMAASGRLSEDRIMQIAAENELDVERLRADMNDSEIEAAVEANLQLAQELGIEGTPTFIVGDTLVPGAIDYANLIELVKEAQRDCTTC